MHIGEAIPPTPWPTRGKATCCHGQPVFASGEKHNHLTTSKREAEYFSHFSSIIQANSAEILLSLKKYMKVSQCSEDYVFPQLSMYGKRGILAFTEVAYNAISVTQV